MTVRLDEHQSRAVLAAAADPTNVVAGAGTGKTTVLVERFLKLVQGDGVAPDRILALTFTLKAAGEMRQRIHAAVAKAAPTLVESLYGAWIMNFHQFGLRIIRDNAPALGIYPDVDVVTPAQFRRIETLLRRRFLDGRIDGVAADFGGAMPAPTKMDSRFDLFYKVALKCRSDGFDAARLAALCTDEDDDGYRAYVDSIVAIARAYDDELRRRNLIDFSDMITIPARGFDENPSLCERYRARFDHILVDEFQDTSRAQNELLRVLSGGRFENVTVVGDRKQSIYRWRDARVENIRDFPGKEEPLRTNYRSRQNILDIAHAFIATDPELGGEANNAPLEAHRGAGAHPVVLFHPDSDEAWDEEAEALAAWIRHLVDGADFEGLPAVAAGERVALDGIAVLLRSLKPSNGLPAIERAFERHGIAYAVIGGANAAETRALEAWHAAMSLLLPGNRVRELLTVLEGEPVCADDATLNALVHDVKRRPGGVDLLGDDDIAHIDDAAAAARVRELRDMVEEMRRRWMSDDFRSFVYWALDESPLALRLFARSPDGATARAIHDLVHEVFEALDSVARTDAPGGLASLLDHLRAAIDDKKFREESDVRLPAGRVRIMTIHQSKGLEFPAVAVAGIKPPRQNSDGFFLSHERGVFFSSSEAKRWGRARADSDERPYEVEMEDQEARCLMYVAMTRAEDHLWVSTPYREGIRRSQGTKPSLFTDVLGCAQKVEPIAVIRRAPVLAQRAAAAAPAAVGIAVSALDDAVGAWNECRARLDALSQHPAPLFAPLALVTWSGLLSYRRCPLQYRYRFRTRYGDIFGAGADAHGTAAAVPGTDERSIAEGAAIPPGMTPADYGVFVHEVLRRVYAAPGGEVDAAIRDVAALTGGGESPAVAAAVRSLVDGVAASEVGAPGDGVRTEEPFHVRLDSMVVHGVFDRIERGPGGLRVIDYKVGVENPDYEFQVQLYTWALEHIDDDAAEGLLCYLRPGGAHVRRVTSRDTVDAVGALAGALEASLTSGEFEATPGSVCGDCPYRSVCPESAAG